MESLLDPGYRDAWYAAMLAGLITLVTIPLVIRYARHVGAVDAPEDERRVHTVATPRLGGIAMLLGLISATLLFMPWNLPDGTPFSGPRLLDAQQLAITLAGGAGVCLLGAADDVLQLNWRPKLLGQALVATGTVLGPWFYLADGDGVGDLTMVVDQLDLPFVPPFHLPVALAVGLVVLWIVAVMNMVNFMDGVDGLAAGQVAIIAGTFAVIAASYGRLGVAVLAAATAGAAVGFLPWNWRRGGAKIFMGDSGSMLLGFLLASISVQGVLKTAAAISIVIPLALLAVPILDTSFVVLKRMKYHRPVSNADTWHLHHRLLNVGLSPRRVAATLWIWTASMSAVSLALRFVEYGNSKHWRVDGLLVLGGVVLVAVAVSVRLAMRLEIIKSRAVRARNRQVAAARAERERLSAAEAGHRG